MTRFAWTDQRVAELRRLVAADATGPEIAAQLGCSHNALRVKMHKLRLRITDAAVRRAHSERQRAFWADPASRAKATAGIAAAWQGADERRAKAAARARQQAAEGRCGRGPTPEHAARISASLRRYHAERRAAAEQASRLVIRSPLLEAQAGIVRSTGTMQPPAGYAQYRAKLPPVRTMFEAR